MLSMKIEKNTVRFVATEIRKMNLRTKTTGVSIKEIDEMVEVVSELGEQKFIYWGYDHEYFWFEEFALKASNVLDETAFQNIIAPHNSTHELIDHLELDPDFGKDVL